MRGRAALVYEERLLCAWRAGAPGGCSGAGIFEVMRVQKFAFGACMETVLGVLGSDACDIDGYWWLEIASCVVVVRVPAFPCMLKSQCSEVRYVSRCTGGGAMGLRRHGGALHCLTAASETVRVPHAANA